MKKKEKTPQEIAELEQIKAYNKAYRHQVTLVKNACKNQSIRIIELQLDFMQNNKTILPNKMLDKQDTIKAFKEGIEQFKEGLL